MRRLVIAVLALLACVAAFPAMAQDGPRFALLIGNKGYTPTVGPLVNPHTDVDLVAASLKKLGFTPVVLKDATYKAMDTALKRHVEAVRRAGAGAVSFFYYSGHGAANGETRINYLVPVDVADADDDRLWYESFQHNTITDMLTRQAPNALHYMVLDACRNELNLTKSGKKSLGTQKGFVPVEYTSGVLIAYATAPGKTAADGAPGGGPYARALADEIVKPGVEAYTMFRNVGLRVKGLTGQDPWLSSSTLPEVYLAGRAAAAVVAPVAPPAPAAPAQQSAVAEAWLVVRETRSAADLDAFLARFGDTFCGDLAKRRLAELKAAQVAAVDQGQPPGPSAGTQPKPSGQGSDLISLACDGVSIEVGTLKERLCIKPGNNASFRDCWGANDDSKCGPQMVVIPAGEFVMGSPATEPGRTDDEGPQRTVRIAKPFAIGKFEVTLSEWDACVVDRGCAHMPDDRGWGRRMRPVIHVSWNDAKEYLAWLSEKSGQPYRLLSEAEWEYAARAGTTTPFSTGRTITSDQANFDGNHTYSGSAKGTSRLTTVEVGNFKPNAFGLHDMHGNVSEWVEDAWHPSYQGAPNDGSVWQGGDMSLRVQRGGFWSFSPGFIRSASRVEYPSAGRDSSVGFRVARTLSH